MEAKLCTPLIGVSPLCYPQNLRQKLRTSRARKTITMCSAQPIKGVKDLVSVDGKDQVWLLDQFGVLHNGKKSFPEAVTAVRELHAAGARLVILSNSSRRSSECLRKLEPMGFNPDWFFGAITSGEITHQMLSRRDVPDSVFSSLGRRCIHFTWAGRGTISLQGLDLEVVNQAQDADFILAHGTEAIGGPEGSDPVPASLEEMRTLMSEAVGRNLPMIVANPDIVTVSGDALITMPGTLARWYEEMGGEVHLMGKPASVVYDAVLQMTGLSDFHHLVAVGDSLEHDIRGAAEKSIASVFISDTGIHKTDLPQFPNGQISERQAFELKLSELSESLTVPIPTYYMDRFRW